MEKTKTSTQLSIETSKTVRGYQVRRLPLGEYLRAIEEIRTMPETILKACFPGLGAEQIMDKLRRIDKNALAGLLVNALAVAPAEMVRLVSVLTGVEQEALLTDPLIGLDGAAEMLEAFWELNGIENFIRAAEKMAAQVKQLRAKTGSKG